MLFMQTEGGFFMEKKKSSDPAELLCAAAKGLIVMAVLFAAGVLASAALIYRGVIPMEYARILLWASVAAAAFGSTVFCALRQKWPVFLTGVLVQGIFLAVLVLLGMLAWESMTDWLALAVAFVAALGAVFAASVLFGKKKKKKFQKNAAIRLKRK